MRKKILHLFSVQSVTVALELDEIVKDQTKEMAEFSEYSENMLV